MKSIFVTALFLVSATLVHAQNNGFPFGNVLLREVEMKNFPADTSAAAVVLNEFGEAYIDQEGDHNLVFEYHTLIKVLKPDGSRQANVNIPLFQRSNRRELLRSVKASSFNMENGSMKETKMDPKSVRTVHVDENWDDIRIAVPNVRVGSVIEIYYVTESPFLYNFKHWEFQSDIPKIKSEYWATVPANYVFNITLRGYLSLNTNDSDVLKECFQPGGGNVADCTRYKWGMKNIPAFITEEYMTAQSNFVSKINFELSEIRYFDGRKDRITKEWKDADQELRQSDRFGLQLKRGKSIADGQINTLIASETNLLVRAQKIYAFIQAWYTWDEGTDMFTESGIRKAFEQRKGNVADINLSLVAALRHADIEADPVALSTRDNGLPTELHPVLSDFNYVISKAKIDGKEYLLDATEDFLPFGTIPQRCINGKGRVFAEKGSYWYDLKPSVKARRLSLINMKILPDGMVKGTFERIYIGYDAIETREDLHIAGSPENYVNELKKKYPDLDIANHSIDNPQDLSKPVTEKFTFEWPCYDSPDTKSFLFALFIFDRINTNPFRSPERRYPVDYGSPVEQVITMNLEYPEAFEIAGLPSKVGVTLPNASARYVFDIRQEPNKVSIQCLLTIGKPVFSSDEYHYLKELYAQIVANQQAELLFKRKG